MPHCGDATEGESSLAASGVVKGPGDARYLGTFSVLNKTNYPVWAMRMQLHLEAHSLWDAIELKTIARKKDRQALFKQWDLLRSTKRSSSLISRKKKNKSFLTGLRKQRVELPAAEDVVEVMGVTEDENCLVTNPQ
ncbi:unnamed protein product [Spirodela intermedia]|uniref:DUF4219 domain-containing protein n=1 Tax=Spirodela intermedia TaxID=51605 RepID=A0A7I8J3R1_SPIIN|nr:unnamed protein product [Spirodela intermedia]CAA6664886.1 unnamed protein product [Spirodela intermedia]